MDEIYDVMLGWKHKWFKVELPKILAVFDKHDIDGMIKDDLRKKVEYGKNKLVELQNENLRLREQGLSYAERKPKVDKMMAIQKVMDKWQSILEKPMKHPTAWFEEGDYQRIKSLGFKKFINLYYELAYD